MVFKKGIQGANRYGQNIKSNIGKSYRKYGGGVKGTVAGASAAVGGAGALPMKLLNETAKDVVKPSGKFWSILTKNKSVMGINLSIGSMLKQSQVFTGAVSSILQIVGAMVDVLIAPWIIPLFIPLVKKMASFIPKIREWSQALAEKYVPLIKNMLSDIWSGKGGFFKKVWESIKGLIDIVWENSGLADWWRDAEGIIGAFKTAIGLIRDILEKIGLIAPKKAVEKFPSTLAEMGITYGPPDQESLSKQLNQVGRWGSETNPMTGPDKTIDISRRWNNAQLGWDGGMTPNMSGLPKRNLRSFSTNEQASNIQQSGGGSVQWDELWTQLPTTEVDGTFGNKG